MMANLFGDFVKGKDYTYLPDIVYEGVRLHREIDDYIDNHPLVVELRRNLYQDLPKIAGIAIDLYFDHILAREWKEYSKSPLPEFIDDFFKYALNPKNQRFKKGDFHYPEGYIYLLEMIHKNKWILSYQQIDGLIMASNGLSKRISFPNKLTEAPKIYLSNRYNIENTFNSFMEDAIQRFPSIFEQGS